MVCDAHVHFIPEELSEYTSFYKGVWTDLDKLKEYLDRFSIEKALLVYPSTDAAAKLGGSRKECDIYNRFVEQIIKEDERIVAAGIIDLSNEDGLTGQVESLYSRGFSGVSIPSSYQGDFQIEKVRRLSQLAQKFNLFIFVHPQTINPIGFERIKDPLLMPVLEYSFDLSMFLGLLMTEGILQDFDVTFIFSSLGGVTPFLSGRFDRVYRMLRPRGIVKDLKSGPSQILKKIYVDTSGASLKNIELAIDLFGLDHILWGSDYPVNPPIQKNLAMLDSLEGIAKDKIIYQNFKSLVT